MLLTNNSDAGRRVTETITTGATVIPNVVNVYAVDGQLCHWYIFLVFCSHAYSWCKDVKFIYNIYFYTYLVQLNNSWRFAVDQIVIITSVSMVSCET